jgi:integrase
VTEVKPHYTYQQFQALEAMKPEAGNYTKGTLAHVIQRVIDDVAAQASNEDVKQHGETHMYGLKATQRMPIGKAIAAKMTRADFIEFAKWRRDQPNKRGGKVGAATAKQSLSYISGVLKYACATWDDCADLVPVLVQLEAAGKFLTKRGLVAKATRRTRRVADEEVVALLDYYRRHPGRVLRMQEVIAFCLASGRRRGEVCRITWGDVDFENQVYWVRDVKHPTKKKGNDKEFILFPVIEQIIRRQIRQRPDDPKERIFPFIPECVSQSFITAKKAIAAETGNPAILSLRLHDHRAEAISKWLLVLDSIEDVAMCVSGHDNLKTLKAHYDRRKPMELVKTKYPALMQKAA